MNRFYHGWQYGQSESTLLNVLFVLVLFFGNRNEESYIILINLTIGVLSLNGKPNFWPRYHGFPCLSCVP